jgi:hypothetical protein
LDELVAGADARRLTADAQVHDAKLIELIPCVGFQDVISVKDEFQIKSPAFGQFYSIPTLYQVDDR